MCNEPVEFDLPEGFTMPEGVEAGKDFDVVCTLRSKPNGHVCLVKVGESNMPGYDKGTSQEPKKDYSDYAKGMQKTMNEGAQGGGTSGGVYA